MIIRGDCIEQMKKMESNSVDAIITDPPYGLSFMGKKWDYDVPSIEIWKEALRVLKAGGFLLSFAGTRTYHRMCVNIEDAGFEIRDMISWLYGSGFPKSLNIGKQIDKIQGNEREVIGKGEAGYMVDIAKERKEQGYRPNLTKSTKEFDLTKGNSEWEGWGTALKPACEPIVVARKPLSEKNVALNVLKWGTGGINIDECRIETNPEVDDMLRKVDRNKRESETWEKGSGFKNEKNSLTGVRPDGRFPANIILDEEAGEFLGDSKRFFYCAKASKSERNFGCEELEAKNQYEQNKWTENDYRKGKGEKTTEPRANNHPTVKPIKLMEYLIKLVSREGAIVLDPFLGSGTTAIACVKLNRQFIGIEKEEEYIKIAKARIKPFMEQSTHFKEKKS